MSEPDFDQICYSELTQLEPKVILLTVLTN